MLEVNNISVNYSGIQAIDAISLTVESGKITAVVGSNGAGKSTLLRAISGLVNCGQGTIEFNGIRLNGHSPAKIVEYGIAHVPEGRELFPRMTIKENLLVGAHLCRDQARIRKNIDRVCSVFPVLAEKICLDARQLSGGEQQMLAFGRSMMSDPKLYLLDEPSIGLAPRVEEQLMSSISTICRETGAGVLLVEQNAMVALEISNTGYVMELGKIIMSGKSSDLIHNPAVAAAYLGMGA